MILALRQVWVNRMDTGQGITAPSTGRSQAYSTQFEVRTMAAGRQRGFGTVGERGTAAFTLLRLDLATVAILREWATLPVQVRDHRGQRWFGSYDGVDVTEWKTPTLYSVAFTLQATTTVEGV